MITKNLQTGVFDPKSKFTSKSTQSRPSNRRLKSSSPPTDPLQLPLWEARKAEVIEEIALQNGILSASKVPDSLALGEQRYYLDLSFRFPLQFSRDEVARAIKATDDWVYPSDLEKLQRVIEAICTGGRHE